MLSNKNLINDLNNSNDLNFNCSYYSLEAECALLGALLLNNDLFDDVNTIVSSVDSEVFSLAGIYSKKCTVVTGE